MTTKEYLVSKLRRFDVDEESIDILIFENNLNGEEQITEANELRKIICNGIAEWIPLYSSITEGGVTKSWNFESLKLYYSLLCAELNIEDTLTKEQRVINNASNRW